MEKRFKMYKAGKFWLVAGAALIGTVMGVSNTNVSADSNPAPTTAETTTANASENTGNTVKLDAPKPANETKSAEDTTSSADYQAVTGAQTGSEVATNTDASQPVPQANTTVDDVDFLTTMNNDNGSGAGVAEPDGTYNVQGVDANNYYVEPMDDQTAAQPGDVLHFYSVSREDSELDANDKIVTVKVAGSNDATSYANVALDQATVDANAANYVVAKIAIPGGELQVSKTTDGEYRMSTRGDAITGAGFSRSSYDFNTLISVPATYHYYDGSKYMTGVVFFNGAASTPAETPADVNEPTTEPAGNETAPAENTAAESYPAETTVTVSEDGSVKVEINTDASLAGNVVTATLPNGSTSTATIDANGHTEFNFGPEQGLKAGDAIAFSMTDSKTGDVYSLDTDVVVPSLDDSAVTVATTASETATPAASAEKLATTTAKDTAKKATVELPETAAKQDDSATNAFAAAGAVLVATLGMASFKKKAN